MGSILVLFWNNSKKYFHLWRIGATFWKKKMVLPLIFDQIKEKIFYISLFSTSLGFRLLKSFTAGVMLGL
ncbi:unnamed protein product [Rhizophagus irregularis]|nr:unnamed protein product [Rhizophagus irregularis]